MSIVWRRPGPRFSNLCGTPAGPRTTSPAHASSVVSPTKNRARPSITMKVSSYGCTWRRGPAPISSAPYVSTVVGPPNAIPSTEPLHGPPGAGSKSLACDADRPSPSTVAGSKSFRDICPLLYATNFHYAAASRQSPAPETNLLSGSDFSNTACAAAAARGIQSAGSAAVQCQLWLGEEEWPSKRRIER